MDSADWQKAARYIENEEASFLAYRFFAQRFPGLTPFNASGKPARFEDFYTWLWNSCVIAGVNAGNGASYLDALARFAKKLYWNSLSFSASIEGLPSCVIYDSPRYLDGFLRALTMPGIFTFPQSNGALILSPPNAASLNAFTAYVEAMKDASKTFITGTKIIVTVERRMPNPGNLVVNLFKALVGRQFGMRAPSILMFPPGMRRSVIRKQAPNGDEQQFRIRPPGALPARVTNNPCQYLEESGLSRSGMPKKRVSQAK
jgi:hypothetical protein